MIKELATMFSNLTELGFTILIVIYIGILFAFGVSIGRASNQCNSEETEKKKDPYQEVVLVVDGVEMTFKRVYE